MIKLNCFLFAEYAALSADNRLVIAGTFENVDVQRNPGAPADALDRIAFPKATLVIVTEASIADGLTHEMRLRVLDGNGHGVLDDDITFDIAYQLNPHGRPLRNNLLVNIMGLMLPGVDDYTFMLYVDNDTTPLGEL